MIGDLDHQRGALEERLELGEGGHAPAVGQELQLRVEGRQRLGGDLHLRAAEIGLAEQDLPVQVRHFDGVVVDEDQGPEPGAGEAGGGPRPEPAAPDHHDPRTRQPRLHGVGMRGRVERREVQELARVALRRQGRRPFEQPEVAELFDHRSDGHPERVPEPPFELCHVGHPGGQKLEQLALRSGGIVDDELGRHAPFEDVDVTVRGRERLQRRPQSQGPPGRTSERAPASVTGP